MSKVATRDKVQFTHRERMWLIFTQWLLHTGRLTEWPTKGNHWRLHDPTT